MQQIYRITPMLKYDFNKIAKQFYWNLILAWVFYLKFAAYFRTLFLKNTSGGQILKKYGYEYTGFWKLVFWYIYMYCSLKDRSNLQQVFCKKDVFKNFAKFTGKQLCQSLFFNKVFYNFIKKERLAQMFSSEFCEIFKNKFFL